MQNSKYDVVYCNLFPLSHSMSSVHQYWGAEKDIELCDVSNCMICDVNNSTLFSSACSMYGV